ncbi:unnamed protein product, partial [Coregonus sp. 'balchen']
MAPPSDDKEGFPPANGEPGLVKSEGCHCKTWQKHTTNRSLVRSIEYRFPAPPVCNSTEIMSVCVYVYVYSLTIADIPPSETLADGREGMCECHKLLCATVW